MVDISSKIETKRTATASCRVIIPNEVLDKLKDYSESSGVIERLHSAKGPIIATSIIAGVMAAKQTSTLIPFCHFVPLESCDISMQLKENTIEVKCSVATTHKTGVEMEALVGATNAALCVYDMCKALSHDITISDVMLLSKKGGKRNFDRSKATFTDN
jgi:cyclic pyranopterin phosphate synthase